MIYYCYDCLRYWKNGVYVDPHEAWVLTEQRLCPQCKEIRAIPQFKLNGDRLK